MPICSIANCKNKHKGLGYCSLHYQRFKKKGTTSDSNFKKQEKHGLKKTPEYSVWSAMKKRCYNQKSINYHLYGGSGVTVCDRWINSFNYFLEDMGQRPSKSHSIDRINNDGNYEPSNCRWATRQQQVINRHIWGSSGFRGVTYVRKYDKWMAQIHHNYINIHVGTYNIKERAALAYDTAAIQLHGDNAITNIL